MKSGSVLTKTNAAPALGGAFVVLTLLGDTLIKKPLSSGLETGTDMALAGGGFFLYSLAAATLPLFAFFLCRDSDGVKNKEKLLAVLTLSSFVFELFYDIALFGDVFAKKGWNPLFPLLISSFVVYFVKYFLKDKNLFKITAVTIGTVAWTLILGTSSLFAALLTLTFCLLKKNRKLALSVAAVISAVISLASPFCILAPLTVAFLFFLKE